MTNVVRLLGRQVTTACVAYLRWRGYTSLPGVPPPKRPSYFYDEGNLTTPLNHDFCSDPRFVEALKESRSSPTPQLGFHHGRWNLHVSLWCATHAIALNADIVQLGVFEATEASGIIRYTDFANRGRRMYLVDTFTGIPDGMLTDEEIKAGADSSQWRYKEVGNIYGYVRDRMKPYPNVSVIQGTVPDILPSVPSDRIGLLMLDMNASAPELAGAEYFWDRIVPGGVILSDDYGHSRKGEGYYAQKVMFDAFARSKGLEVLSIPTGHGMIVKPR